MEISIKKDELINAWAFGKPIVYKSKEYAVNKMNYGTFFLTPFQLVVNENFMCGFEIWLQKSELEKDMYEYDTFLNKK